MIKKLMLVGGTAVALSCSVAVAATVPDTITAKATASAGGSKKKPKAVSASFTADAMGANGARAVTPTTLRWQWSGIKTNGGAFPRCSAATIDAAQSDAGCPKGSLVGTGTINAQLGPETDRMSAGVSCVKDIAIYNDGPKKGVFLLKGDPSKCAGVSYQPPISLTIEKKGTDIGFVIPDNIAHPLPGLEGSINELTVTYPKRTVKKNGKKIAYLTSTGCTGSSRGFVFTQIYPEGEYDTSVTKASAGSC